MNVEDTISSVVVSVIGLAIVAVLVSRNANTANVIGASGSGLANVIKAAVSPVTGGGGTFVGTSGSPLSLLSNSTFGGT